MFTGAFVALTWLASSHAKIISLGETSIEAHINKSETRRLKLLNKVCALSRLTFITFLLFF